MDSLPDELGLKILQLLELEDILTIRLVSSKWCRLANDKTIWLKGSFDEMYHGQRWIPNFIRIFIIYDKGGLGLDHIIFSFINLCNTDIKALTFVKGVSNLQIYAICQKYPKITHIDLKSSIINNEGLKYLCQLPLYRLSLERCNKITDDGMEYIAGIDTLRHLLLEGTNISDHGLIYLAETEIEWLDLEGTYITDIGMSYLSKLPLEKLWITSPVITNDGFKHIQVPKLKILGIIGTKITEIHHIKCIDALLIKYKQYDDLKQSIKKTMVKYLRST